MLGLALTPFVLGLGDVSVVDDADQGPGGAVAAEGVRVLENLELVRPQTTGAGLEVGESLGRLRREALAAGAVEALVLRTADVNHCFETFSICHTRECKRFSVGRQ